MKYQVNHFLLIIDEWYLTYIKRAKCFICGSPATLALGDGLYECEDCAYIANEMAIEQSSQK